MQTKTHVKISGLAYVVRATGLLASAMIIIGLGVLVQSRQASAVALPEWSNDTRDITPSGRVFLGQFSNQTVSLNLADLPTHQTVTVSFDLFVLGSWDGNISINQGGNQVGPDIFRLSYGSSGGELFRTTFSNWEPGSASEEVRQAYPGTVPTGDFPGRTGAAENNTLGYTHSGYPGNIQDAVYHLSITFPHVDGTLQMNFGAEGLEEIANESWGIDNVQVRVGP